jgi:hypothetical protein
MEAEEKFEGWCVVELMGHNQIAGYVSEQIVIGIPLLRVDVPEVEGVPGFSKLYGKDAIYGITPTSEEMVRLCVAQLRVKPLNIWLPELHKALPPPTVDVEREDGSDDEQWVLVGDELP